MNHRCVDAAAAIEFTIYLARPHDRLFRGDSIEDARHRLVEYLTRPAPASLETVAEVLLPC